MPPHLVAAALAVGNTVGQTAVAIPLVIVTRRICGRAAVQGAGHAALAGLAAGAVAAAAGVGVCLAVPASGKLAAAAVAAGRGQRARSSRSAWSPTSWTGAT